MLLQSKAKDEHLGLVETDVLIDQAILVNVVEVLENSTHKHLKDFIVLWRGGFRIAMAFLGVICKMFKDLKFNLFLKFMIRIQKFAIQNSQNNLM